MPCKFVISVENPNYGPFEMGTNPEVGTFVIANDGNERGTGQIDVYTGIDLDSLEYSKSFMMPPLDPFTSSVPIPIDIFIPSDYNYNSMAVGIKVWCEHEDPPVGWEFYRTTRWEIKVRPPLEGGEQQPGPPPGYVDPGDPITPCFRNPACMLLIGGVGIGILALLLMKK